jgi:cellulose biosynthesis protein BcsQ
MDQIDRAVEAADFVLIPVQASAFDLMAARAVVSMSGERSTPFAFVLNREHARRETLNNSAATHLRNLGVLLPETVRDLAAHVAALNKGKAGTEHPDGKQAKEVRDDIAPLLAAVKAKALASIKARVR